MSISEDGIVDGSMLLACLVVMIGARWYEENVDRLQSNSELSYRPSVVAATISLSGELICVTGVSDQLLDDVQRAIRSDRCCSR
jgi:hypothetical protein